MTSSSFDAAALLSGLASSYSTPAAAVVVEDKPRRRAATIIPPAPVASVAPSAPKASVAPVAPKVQDASTAKEFLASVIGAGRRIGKGGRVAFAGELAKKEDEIKALETFVGYNPGEPHGTQLDAARMVAVGLTSKVKPAPEKSSFPSAAGYVAGLPNATQKLVRDLLGREQLSADRAAEYRKSGNAGMLALEEERLEAIRSELSQYIKVR